MSDFYNRLDLLRRNKGESIIDIAHYLGISGPAIHGWKKGGLPKTDKLHLLAEHYGVTVDFLLTGDKKTDEQRKEFCYKSHKTSPEFESEHKSDNHLQKEIDVLRNELRDARAVIRDMAASIAALTANKTREKKENP